MTSKEALQQCLAEAKNNSSGQLENLQEAIATEKIENVEMVKLSSLLSAKDMSDLKPLAAVFAKYDGQVYALQQGAWAMGNTMIPATTKLMRDESQTLVGISMVSGG